MWNMLGYKPSWFQTVVLIDAAYNHESFSIINFIFPYFKMFSQLYYSIFSLYGNIFDLLFMLYFLCRRGIDHFGGHFRRIGPVLFLSKDENVAVREEEKDGDVFISPQKLHLFSLINRMIKVLFLICTLTWRANNYVSRQEQV